MIFPLAPALLSLRAGAQMMPLYYRYGKFLHGCLLVIWTIGTRGCISRGGRAHESVINSYQMISPENWPLQELLMGVETPIPPNTINAAAPGGAPPRRIKTVEIIISVSWFGCEPDRFKHVSPEHFFSEPTPDTAPTPILFMPDQLHC
jgi:hypothetical protein